MSLGDRHLSHRVAAEYGTGGRFGWQSAMRGEVYCIEGNTIFVMGGGYSIDKYRRTEGVSWWPQEMPSEEEYHNAIMNLEKVGNHVDYIITHTAPFGEA